MTKSLELSSQKIARYELELGKLDIEIRKLQERSSNISLFIGELKDIRDNIRDELK